MVMANAPTRLRFNMAGPPLSDALIRPIFRVSCCMAAGRSSLSYHAPNHIMLQAPTATRSRISHERVVALCSLCDRPRERCEHAQTKACRGTDHERGHEKKI